MIELMFQAGVKGMSERSELIPCSYLYSIIYFILVDYIVRVYVTSAMHCILVNFACSSSSAHDMKHSYPSCQYA